MKNLILRTLRQLYAVSEIIILIRWVTPPPKVENLQFEFFLSFEIPQLFFSTQSIHKFFMCVLFETRSKSSLCPCQLKNLRTELLTYLIQIFGFAAQTVPHPTKYLSIHPRSNTISTSQYVGDTCQANEKGQGHVRPISSGEQFFTMAINTPSPLPHVLYSALSLSLSLSLELLKP